MSQSRELGDTGLTRCVAFRTPGLIPLESFTTFGVNVKPNTVSPFGYFGTGLKYAIAVLLRSGCRIVMWRGISRYEFYVKREDFRGKDFEFVRMKRQTQLLLRLERAYHTKLPFTLELGKNWELWQAFRELETNTRDEGGQTQLTEWPDDARHENSSETLVLVYGERFVDEYLDMGKHFLEGGKTLREDEAIQIIDRPSSHIYYRGVRIMDLKEEAEFTYNILSSVDLTEDRTAKYPYLIEQMIANHWATSEDEERVPRVVQTNRWESRGLNYAYAYSAPSRTFSRLAPESSNRTIQQYLEEKDPSVSTTTTIQLVIPKPEITPVELAEIADAVNKLLGLDRIKAKNLTTNDAWDTGEWDEPVQPSAPAQPSAPEPDEEDLIPY